MQPPKRMRDVADRLTKVLHADAPAIRMLGQIREACAQCNKPNTWRLPLFPKLVEVFTCRHCRAPNHIITTAATA